MTDQTLYDGLFQGDLDRLVEHALYNARRSCINCQHFEFRGEHCKKFPLAGRPPALTIARGCPHWEGGPPF